METLWIPYLRPRPRRVPLDLRVAEIGPRTGEFHPLDGKTIATAEVAVLAPHLEMVRKLTGLAERIDERSGRNGGAAVLDGVVERPDKRTMQALNLNDVSSNAFMRSQFFRLDCS